MKRLCSMVGCLIVILWAGQVNAQTVSHRFYGNDFGIVEYEISGAAKGKEILYFDGYGERQARFRSAETAKWGFLNTVTLNLKESVIYYDPNKNLGQRWEDQNVKKLLSAPPSEDGVLLAVELIKILGGTKAGDGQVLDKQCEIWENSASGIKMWLWNGVPLRSETVTPDGKVTYTAVKIDEATIIDEAVFATPPEIRFMDRDINQILISSLRKEIQ